MTLQSLIWPGMTPGMTATPAFIAGSLLDAAGEYDAVIFQAQEAMAISHVGIRPSGVSGSPTVDIRIETVDSAGVPSGTLWAANTNVITGVVPLSWSVYALGATATIAAGQIVCVKVVYNTGTSLTIRRVDNLLGFALPYTTTNLNSVITRREILASLSRNLALGSSSSVFYRVAGLSPLVTITTNAFSNSVAGAERGALFQLPFPATCTGIRHYNAASTGDFTVFLRDNAGNDLSGGGIAMDGDTLANTTFVAGEYYFATPVKLAANTSYRVGLQPMTATNITLMTGVCNSANEMSAMPGGANFIYTTFTTGGGWIDSATGTVPWLDLLLVPTVGYPASRLQLGH